MKNRFLSPFQLDLYRPACFQWLVRRFLNANVPMQLRELQDLVSPDLQLVDGEVTVKDLQGICLRLIAVDSTSWDVETNCKLAVLALVGAYPNAVDISTD